MRCICSQAVLLITIDIHVTSRSCGPWHSSECHRCWDIRGEPRNWTSFSTEGRQKYVIQQTKKVFCRHGYIIPILFRPRPHVSLNCCQYFTKPNIRTNFRYLCLGRYTFDYYQQFFRAGLFALDLGVKLIDLGYYVGQQPLLLTMAKTMDTNEYLWKFELWHEKSLLMSEESQ